MPFFHFRQNTRFFRVILYSLKSRNCSCYTYIFAKTFAKINIFLKTNIFASICQNRMSSKYFHKNGPFVSHVADKFCLFLRNLKKSPFFNFANFFKFLQIIASKVLRKCENINFVWYVVFLWITLFKDMSKYSQPVSIFIHGCNGAKPITEDDVGGFGDIFTSRQHAGIWRAPWGNELFKIPPSRYLVHLSSARGHACSR